MIQKIQVSNSLILKYFNQHFTYAEICQLLGKKHNIRISVSSLKRMIYTIGLRRKNVQESDIEDICNAMIEELYSSGYNLGYRALWSKLKKKYHLIVKRDTVYELLKEIDPEGVAARFGNRLRRRQYLSPGPNYAWHLDGYDKLKPYGFAVHACVDGYSRYILWLEVATTNNDPKVTANYFLETVKKYKCLPNFIRSDKGTENILIESLQICLRKDHEDEYSGERSYFKGKSVHNQRIESYWGRMRQHTADFYIQFFKCMVQENLFNGSDLQKMCLQYSFGPLIQYDLYMTAELWNEHRIRKQTAQNNVCGKPYLLYNLPEKYGAIDHRKEVNLSTIDDLIESVTIKPQLVNSDFKKQVDERVQIDLEKPRNPEEALQLYIKLKNILET